MSGKTAKEVKKETSENQQAEVSNGKKLEKRKGVKSLQQSHTQWDFKENEVFIGYFVGEFKADVTNNSGELEKDKLIGFVVEDEDGEQWTVPNWSLISEGFNAEFVHPEQGQTSLATQPEDSRSLIQIVYGGQGKKKNGQPYTIINMDILDW